MNEDDSLPGHIQELRRGTVVMACLATLAQPRYGYALLETLSDAGISVDSNTLYPLLRRLEKQGLLESQWNTDEARPRKFYRVSPQGRAVLDTLLAEWRNLNTAIESMALGADNDHA